VSGDLVRYQDVDGDGYRDGGRLLLPDELRERGWCFLGEDVSGGGDGWRA